MTRLGVLLLLLTVPVLGCDTDEDGSMSDGGPYPPLNAMQAKGYHRSHWWADDDRPRPPEYGGHDRPSLGLQVTHADSRVMHIGFYSVSADPRGNVVHAGWDVLITRKDGGETVCETFNPYRDLDQSVQSNCAGDFNTCMQELLLGSPEEGQLIGDIFFEPHQEGGTSRLPNQQHAPIFVLLEPQPVDWPAEMRACYLGEEDYYDAVRLGMIPTETMFAFEGAIIRNFEAGQIFKPGDLRGAAASVRDRIARSGWPAMQGLHGRFIFILLDEGEMRDAYETRLNWDFGMLNPNDPHMFTLARDENDPNAAFFSVPAAETDRIRRLVERGFIVHAHSIDAAELEAARLAGAHLLTGLEISDIAIEGPAVCNPVTAPLLWPGCHPTDFERPPAP